MTEKEMTPKQLLEQEKKLTVKKDNFLVFRFGWSSSFVVPYKDGMEIIKYLINAETYEDSASEKIRIKPMSAEDLHIKILSQQSYVKYKAKALLIGD